MLLQSVHRMRPIHNGATHSLLRRITRQHSPNQRSVRRPKNMMTRRNNNNLKTPNIHLTSSRRLKRHLRSLANLSLLNTSLNRHNTARRGQGRHLSLHSNKRLLMRIISRNHRPFPQRHPTNIIRRPIRSTTWLRIRLKFASLNRPYVIVGDSQE